MLGSGGTGCFGPPDLNNNLGLLFIHYASYFGSAGGPVRTHSFQTGARPLFRRLSECGGGVRPGVSSMSATNQIIHGRHHKQGKERARRERQAGRTGDPVSMFRGSNPVCRIVGRRTGSPFSGIPMLGAAIGLLLIRPEARLLHAQMGSRGRRGEREGDYALQIVGRILVRKIPGLGQPLVRLDGEDLAIQHAAPVSAE